MAAFSCFDPRSEGFADHLFALLPESFGILWVDGVTAHPFTDWVNHSAVRNYFADVAVLAVLRADLVRRGYEAGPDRGRGSLRDRLPLERRFAFCSELLVDLFDEVRQPRLVGVAAELGADAAGMDGCGAHSVGAVAAVEGDGEEDVCGLGATVGDERLVRRVLEVGIFEIDIAIAVAGGGQIDEAASGTE